MQKCWGCEPENRPSLTELHTKTVSYITGYLEMNFIKPSPLAQPRQIWMPVLRPNPNAFLSAAEPHSGDEPTINLIHNSYNVVQWISDFQVLEKAKDMVGLVRLRNERCSVIKSGLLG